MKLLKGQKIDITKGRNIRNLSLRFGWAIKDTAMSVDAAAFILNAQGRCVQDEHFIFYGHVESPNGEVRHSTADGPEKEVVHIAFSKLSESAARIAFTLTIYEGEQQGHDMSAVSDMYVQLTDADSGEVLCQYTYGMDLTRETAIVVGELYRYNDEWKFNAIGSGFYGGLAALCTHFGLEIEERISEVAAAVEEKVIAPIDLRKQKVNYTLEKKKLQGVVARVGIVLDISGSMRKLYMNGTVQEVVERILAVACLFDDNATLDVWVYDSLYSRLPSVTEQDIAGYVDRHILHNSKINKFGANNEPPVMRDVIHKYTEEEESATPVFIIFINDGGVVKSIKKVITTASVQPIFWQFVGIGHSDFEVLKKLDTMEGRVVDNANFIHVHDIGAISDESLYDQLLNEFPVWLKAAKEKRIIRESY